MSKLRNQSNYVRREQVLVNYKTTPETGIGRWHISNLRKKGEIVPVSTTWCRVGSERRFLLQRSSRETEIVRVVRPLVDRFCVWSLTALNPLLVHQRLHRLTLVEVDKADQRMVFDRLRDARFRNVILGVDRQWTADQVGGSDYDVVVQQLISKAPLENKQKGIPTLEKIIVDLFVDRQVLTGVSSSDLDHLVRVAFTEYTIDVRVLRGYAHRRSTWDRLQAYLEWLQVAPREVLNDP